MVHILFTIHIHRDLSRVSPWDYGSTYSDMPPRRRVQETLWSSSSLYPSGVVVKKMLRCSNWNPHVLLNTRRGRSMLSVVLRKKKVFMSESVTDPVVGHTINYQLSSRAFVNALVVVQLHVVVQDPVLFGWHSEGRDIQVLAVLIPGL